MTSDHPNEPTIDPAVFRDLQDSAGPEFVVELVETFLEEAPALIAALQFAVDAGHADNFRREAHSLKSNALTFGATALAALARDLELKGLASVHGAAAAALAPLRLEYERAAAALTALTHA